MKLKFWLIPLLLIEGGALMAVELMGAKFIAPFYGTSLYVWTAVLSITVLGLTLGYHIGGKMAEKRPPVTWLFGMLSLAGAFVLTLPYSTSLLFKLTGGLPLLPGISITALFLLLPPMFCFGTVGPMAVRLLASKEVSLGKVAGTVYFTSTIGGIAITFLFGFYGIPVWGLAFCSLVTGITLLVAITIAYLISIFGKQPSQPFMVDEKKDTKDPKQRPTNSKKSIKIRRSSYLFVVLEGATVMAVELLAARMIAPYFGSSLNVWGTVIGMTLLGLAIGYFIGGILADKLDIKNTLWWVLLGSALFIMLMHITSLSTTLTLKDGNISVAVIFVSAALLLPPLIFLGTVPTLLIRYQAQRLDNIGRETGVVFTISSASGIIALFIMGFYVIPVHGLTMPSIFLGMAIGIVPFIKLVQQKKYISLVFVFAAIYAVSTTSSEAKGNDLKILHYSEGLLGQVLVADFFNKGSGTQKIPSSDRMLFINRMGQTNVNRNSGASNWPYIYFSSSVASKLPENSRALLLGLGGGSVANILIDNKFKVDGVELDKRIADVGFKHFNLNPSVNVIIDDARHYIETTNKNYDLIYFDVFKGDVLPAHVLTKESFEKVKEILSAKGIVIVNFNGFLSEKMGRPGRSIYLTLKAAGFHTKILPTPGPEENRNVLFVASRSIETFEDVRSPLLFRGEPVNIDSLFLDLDELSLKNTILLEDNKPILERWNTDAAHIWRQGYNETYTDLFIENGVPLFN